MQSKGFKEYLEWLIVGVFILLIIGMGARLTIGQQIGIYLNNATNSFTVNESTENRTQSNDTGADIYVLFIDNDTQNLFSDLTINATLSANQTNSSENTITIGIFANGTFEEGAQIRPIGNLTITDTGTIQVSANGTAVLADGIAIGNVTDNLINNGTISVLGNVTGSSGQLMVGGVYAVNATNVVNNRNVTVNGTGGYVNYAENNVPAGFEIASLGNFTNTGNINVSIESVNATAVGVRSYDIGYFNNTGNISVFTNSTSGDMSAVIGVMAGQPKEFEEAHSGQIGTFVNSGNLTVTGYANGTELRAGGVAVFNGTIDEFQNSAKIKVYGNNIGGNATVYGVGAFSDTDGYGNLTNFINAGLINATAIGSNATSSGVHADDYIVHFTNEPGGMITVTANATDGIALATAVSASDIGNFTNKSNIYVYAIGNNTKVSGVFADNNIGIFKNEAGGSITVTANATDGDAEASGVNAGSIGNFTNKGDISVSSIGNTAYGLGVYGASIGNFTNEGNINAYISASNGGIVAGLMSGTPPISIFGSPEPGHVSSFINSGNLTVTGYASGTELYASGVIVFNGTIDEFQNLGKIEVYGENTGGQAGAYGVYAENGVGNFTNEGEINVNSNATIENAGAFGVKVGSGSAVDIDNFINSGKISANVSSNTTGAIEAYGIYVYGKIENFVLENGGEINANATNTNANSLYMDLEHMEFMQTL
jgi:hypothetical protein